jgi:hypothetical protein
MNSDDWNGGPQSIEIEWRDTYFIFFSQSARPTLTQVEATISDAAHRVTTENLVANDDGMFESVLVHAPEDNAALEISYETSEAVLEQCAELAKQLQKDDTDPKQLNTLMKADARLDVMHFERVSNDPFGSNEDEDFASDVLDPTSLLVIIEALANLTEGVPIDPGSGVIMG